MGYVLDLHNVFAVKYPRESIVKGRWKIATSSFIENIRINNPNILEEYAKNLEETDSEPAKPKDKDQCTNTVTDPERIRRFSESILAKNGLRL